MDAAKAAAYLGVAIGTIRNWTSMKFIPHAKRGRIVRYRRAELDRWMAAGACNGRRTHSN
jgi:excisionase family DNA binding protein